MIPNRGGVRAFAPYDVLIEVDDVRLVERSATGGTHLGEVSGRVLRVRRPFLRWFLPAPPGAPRKGERCTVRVRCWSSPDDPMDPPGPARVYTDPGKRPRRLRVWGGPSAAGFQVHDLEEAEG